jgi:predicted component of type VI protein secretion system
MEMVLQDKRDSAIATYKATIEKDFGEGAWEEHFKPDLDEAFKRLPPELQASNDNLGLMVNAIKGAKFNDLQTKLNEAREAQAKAADQEPPRMLDGGHARPRDGETPPELKEWLVDYVKASGDKDMTPKRWAELSTKGDTEDDWWPKEQTK